ncbi:MAG: IS3 family transposase, partial [Chloroflexi bacterium]|nr:IS3 family transposase [Chloroflexota bacterium]MCI0645677.1 IS3 family transposase [Chloroflexota bacterium]
MRQAVEELAQVVPLSQACEALGLPRSSLYRSRQPQPAREPQPRPASPRALSPAEKETVHQVLNSQRFADSAPHQVYA